MRHSHPMTKNTEPGFGALGDSNDWDDPRPTVMFVTAGNQDPTPFYASVKISPVPRVGERVRLLGNMDAGVFVPDASVPSPGRKLSSGAVLSGVVETVEWTLKGKPQNVVVEVVLADVTESND